jgi:hypothetical protein
LKDARRRVAAKQASDTTPVGDKTKQLSELPTSLLLGLVENMPLSFKAAAFALREAMICASAAHLDALNRDRMLLTLKRAIVLDLMVCPSEVVDAALVAAHNHPVIGVPDVSV